MIFSRFYVRRLERTAKKKRWGKKKRIVTKPLYTRCTASPLVALGRELGDTQFEFLGALPVGGEVDESGLACGAFLFEIPDSLCETIPDSLKAPVLLRESFCSLCLVARSLFLEIGASFCCISSNF